MTYYRSNMNKKAALPLILAAGAAAIPATYGIYKGLQGIHSMVRKGPTEQDNRMATLGDMGDAMVSQMNTGKHNLSGLSAAEHTIRMNNDDWYKKHAPDYIRQRIKANAGWTRDENGNFSKAPNAHYDVQHSQENNLTKFKAPEVSNKDKYQAWKNAGKPKDFKDDRKSAEMINTATANTQQAATQGFAESAKATHNIFSDLGGFGMYASARGKAPGWIGWLGNQYRQNPLLVWGGLAAGVIGISALVNSFLSGRNQQQQPVVIDTNAPPTATTSFWRQ